MEKIKVEKDFKIKLPERLGFKPTDVLAIECLGDNTIYISKKR